MTADAPEATLPAPSELLAVSSLCEAFQNTVARTPDVVALRTPGGGTEITWGEYGERVRAHRRRTRRRSGSRPATRSASCW